MGKRELLIIGAFLVLGVTAYQLTAPPPDEGGFSLSGLMDEIRRDIRGNPASAEHAHTSSIPISAEVTELRISNMPRGTEITGEDRADITYELHVVSTGPDEAEALTYAKAVALREEDLGFALALRLSYPREASQTAALTLRVPNRLALVVAGRSIRASNLAAVELDGVVGDTEISNLAGALTGTHRSGALRLDGVASVDLTLQSSTAELRGIRGSVTLDAQRGECLVAQAQGPIRIEQSGTDVTVVDPVGDVQVDGTNGSVHVVNPAGEVRVDTRRADVEIELARGVPMTILTTDDTLRLVLADGAGVVVDARVTSGGRIQAAEFEREPEVAGDEQRLGLTLGDGRARVALRNSRGDIVIRRAR